MEPFVMAGGTIGKEIRVWRDIIPNTTEEQLDEDAAGAVAFMQESIRKHPGEITLICIAPLTNVGLLFAMDPEIPKLSKRIVLMCVYLKKAT